MSYRFLIDECLSPKLVRMAHLSGHQATSVRDRGWCGLPDREIIRRTIEGEFTLVTNNSVDFRGKNPPGPGGLFAFEELHAGLLCINTDQIVMPLEIQTAAFACVLNRLPRDLVNRVLEITAHEDGSHTLVEYELPKN